MKSKSKETYDKAFGFLNKNFYIKAMYVLFDFLLAAVLAENDVFSDSVLLVVFSISAECLKVREFGLGKMFQRV